MLPEGFRWYRHLVGGKDSGDVSLKLGGAQGFEVARVTRRVDGESWLSEVRRCLPVPAHHHAQQAAGDLLGRSVGHGDEEAIWRALREHERKYGLEPYRAGR